MAVDQTRSFSRNPLYMQIHDRILQEVQVGKYLPGDRLPPVRKLSKDFGINHLTVRRGLQSLVQEGWISARPRQGYFVSTTKTADIATKKIALACRDWLLTEGKQHPLLGAWMEGVHRACPSRDWVIQPCFHRKGRFVDDLGPMILRERFPGVITQEMSDSECRFLDSHGIKHVSIDSRQLNVTQEVCISIDNNRVVEQAVRHLVSLGHRDVAFVSYHSGISIEVIASDLLERFGRRYGLSQNPANLVLVEDTFGKPDWPGIERFVQDKLFKLKPVPTGVIVWDEFLANVVFRCCEREGIGVPEDMSLVAMFDLLPATHRIPLTAVDARQICAKTTYVATKVLQRMIVGKPLKQKKILLRAELEIKSSTGPARIKHRSLLGNVRK